MDRTIGVMMDLQAAETTSAVSALLSRMAGALGFPTHAIGPIPQHSEPVPDDFFLVQNWPPIWGLAYEQRGFAAIDPVPRAATLISQPMTVDRIMAGDAGFHPDPRAADFFAFAAELGRPCGIVVPIFGPGGYRALACYSGPGPNPSPADMATLHVWAIYAHDRLRDLTAQRRADERGVLSARELAVLRCARDGLTDAEAAARLAISIRTVRFHMDNLRRKLGGATRAQALANAAAMGLLGA